MKTSNQWFLSWNKRTFLWVLLAFTIMMLLEVPFVFFFDTMLSDIAFLYLYFWAFPQAIILFFTAFKLQVRWTSTAMMTALGIVGAPVEYYLDWVVQQNLVSPGYALLYIPLYMITGLVADLIIIKLHPDKKPALAAFISAFAFTSAVFAATVFATFAFYPTPITLDAPWIAVGNFLLPYSLVSGGLGGYLGYNLAKEIKK